jgi:hypothetical protein
MMRPSGHAAGITKENVALPSEPAGAATYTCGLAPTPGTPRRIVIGVLAGNPLACTVTGVLAPPLAGLSVMAGRVTAEGEAPALGCDVDPVAFGSAAALTFVKSADADTAPSSVIPVKVRMRAFIGVPSGHIAGTMRMSLN